MCEHLTDLHIFQMSISLNFSFSDKTQLIFKLLFHIIHFLELSYISFIFVDILFFNQCSS